MLFNKNKKKKNNNKTKIVKGTSIFGQTPRKFAANMGKILRKRIIGF